MAKYYSCCGGKGGHVGGCELEGQAKGTWRLRSQVPGSRQGWFLDDLVNGKKPKAGQRGHVTNQAIEAMKKRGWIEQGKDGTWKVTKAGEAAHRLWAIEKPSLPPDRQPSGGTGKNVCLRCGGRKKIPGPRRSWIDCPSCNGTGSR